MDALKMAANVLVRPDSAFAAIRDNDRRYFPGALGVASVAYGLSILGIMLDLVGWSATMLLAGVALGLLANIVYLVVVYHLGKAWGGNRHWRKVFSAVLYAGVVMVAMAAVTVSYMYLAQSHTLDSEAFALSVFLARLAVLSMFVVWLAVVTIKAIKTVNGFGTWKAVAVGSAAVAASLAAFAPYLVIAGIISPAAPPI